MHVKRTSWGQIPAALSLEETGSSVGLIPGLGRSPGEGKGFQLQCSGLENTMDCTDEPVLREPMNSFKINSSQVDLFEAPLSNSQACPPERCATVSMHLYQHV